MPPPELQRPESAPRPLALVTGASAGIGRDFAIALAAHGFDLIVIARRDAALRDLAAQIHEQHGTAADVWTMDLARRDQREALGSRLRELGRPVDVLINNAGIGMHGWFHETDLDRELELVELNCAALTHVAKLVVPGMRARGMGRVVNVASVAAFPPGPLMAVYYASKAYALSFSDALAEELDGTGVTVTALCPGPVTTEFQERSGLSRSAPPGGPSPMTAKAVVDAGMRAMLAGRRRSIPGARNKLVVFLNRILPRRVMARLVRNVQLRRLG
ncbi:MAG TPA: SDR family oxidoreductase [Gemmatimonadaceae bacterium]|nr:SDR family oxidoreductase [Gemmatimonadaceae bacterium]